MAKVTCIDVSCWQTNVNYAKVKSAGITAVIIRAGYGRETSQKDSQFETHYKNAKANGLKVGAYWYSYANSVEDAKREAKACLACIKGKTFDMPIYFDMEDSSQTKLGKTTLTAMAKAFCEAIKSGGYRAGVYANLNWFNNYLDYSALKKSYSIWLAQYNSTNDKACDIWQNSSRGKINGVNGNCDTNIVFNSSVFSSSGSASNTATSNTTTSSKTSSSGSSSIKSVQTWLNSTYKTGLKVDGVYGSLTKKALVKALQTELNKQYKAGLVVDGIYGVKTNNAVRNLSYGAKGNLTKILQGLLICNGYNTNGFDGVFGNGTKSAVTSYQAKKRLTVDGVAGHKTFESLCK